MEQLSDYIPFINTSVFLFALIGMVPFMRKWYLIGYGTYSVTYWVGYFTHYNELTEWLILIGNILIITQVLVMLGWFVLRLKQRLTPKLTK